jgi:hypothetical protein
LTRTHLERPKTKTRVIELVLEGLTDRQVAQKISTPRNSVSFQAISKFRARHADVLKPAAKAMVEAAVQHAIATKDARLADLQFLRDKTFEVIDQRGTLEARDVKIAANGQTVDVMRYDAGLVAQLRGVLADAAEEMGERSKIQIDARNQTFNYIELVGQLAE